MKWIYTNWCQGTTSALMSKATLWKNRQMYEPKLAYSVSVLLNNMGLSRRKCPVFQNTKLRILIIIWIISEI